MVLLRKPEQDVGNVNKTDEMDLYIQYSGYITLEVK